MRLVIKGKEIDAPIPVILNTLRSEIRNGKLRDITDEYKDNVAITCPIHKMGVERNPSCNVYCRKDNEDIEYGKVHCFTCGYTATLSQLVATCFDETDPSFGDEWLVERFGTAYSENSRYLPEIVLPNKRKKSFMNESSLEKFNYYDDYMWKRGLTKEVVDRFKIGYDPERKAITFPVWDENGRLVMVTSRSVIDKRFYIEKDKDKPVYLLNFIKDMGITTVYVCESQINALTAWAHGYPAIALFGTGSAYQYEILNRSPIRNYILCFDGDEAGDKGRARFMKNIRDDVLVSYKKLPPGKDVNDLTKEEFDALETFY